MKVKVDKEKCIGCGLCTNLCSQTFIFDAEGKSIVKEQPKTEEDFKCAKDAIASCPVEAISEE